MRVFLKSDCHGQQRLGTVREITLLHRWGRVRYFPPKLPGRVCVFFSAPLSCRFVDRFVAGVGRVTVNTGSDAAPRGTVSVAWQEARRVRYPAVGSHAQGKRRRR
jgi:hypothetical protein